MAQEIDYGVIGIVIGHFLIALLLIRLIRSSRRAATARQYNLHTDAVQFKCGLASWACGCLLFWPVVFCPIDIRRETLPAAGYWAVGPDGKQIFIVGSPVSSQSSPLCGADPLRGRWSVLRHR